MKVIEEGWYAHNKRKGPMKEHDSLKPFTVSNVFVDAYGIAKYKSIVSAPLDLKSSYPGLNHDAFEKSQSIYK